MMVTILFSSTVFAGKNLEASKKFWNKASLGTVSANSGTALLVVGALTVMGISNLVAMGMDQFSDQNGTLSDSNGTLSDSNGSDVNTTVLLADGYPSDYFPEKGTTTVVTKNSIIEGEKTISFRTILTTDIISQRTQTFVETITTTKGWIVDNVKTHVIFMNSYNDIITEYNY